jgi:glucose/arabinose dehydrogenase
LFASLGVYQKGTRGLLGNRDAFQIRENRRYFYVRHFLENGKYSSVVFEGEASPDLKTDSGNSPKLLMKFNNTAGVHYGGGLEFGPDGYFYIAMGGHRATGRPQWQRAKHSPVNGKSAACVT